MVYQISPYTLAKADKLGVKVAPSTKSGKKLDVLKTERKLPLSVPLEWGTIPPI